MIFCQNCGAENVETARFCNMCGTGVAKPGEPGGPLDPEKAEEAPTVEPEAEAAEPDFRAETLVGHGEVDRAKVLAKERELEASLEVEPPERTPMPTRSKTGKPKTGKPKTGKSRTGASKTGKSRTGKSRTGSSSETESGAKRAAAMRAPERTAEPGPPPQDPLDVSTLSLSAIGVRSQGKAWGVLIGLALALMAVGALGMWLILRPDEPAQVAEADPEPDPEPEPVSLGDPIVDGEDEPEVDFVPGTAEPTNPRPRPRPTGNTPTPRTPSPGVGGTSGWTNAPEAERPSTPSNPGTPPTPSSNNNSGGTPAGSDNLGSNNTPANTIPDDEVDWAAMEDEQDLEMEMYSSRVRQVIRTYYIRRASTCFEHETRNNQSVRGTVVVGFQIQADGTVRNTSVDRNSTGSENLGLCLARQVGSWRLPPPPDGEAPMAMQMPFSR